MEFTYVSMTYSIRRTRSRGRVRGAPRFWTMAAVNYTSVIFKYTRRQCLQMRGFWFTVRLESWFTNTLRISRTLDRESFRSLPLIGTSWFASCPRKSIIRSISVASLAAIGVPWNAFHRNMIGQSLNFPGDSDSYVGYASCVCELRRASSNSLEFVEALFSIFTSSLRLESALVIIVALTEWTLQRTSVLIVQMESW